MTDARVASLERELATAKYELKAAVEQRDEAWRLYDRQLFPTAAEMRPKLSAAEAESSRLRSWALRWKRAAKRERRERREETAWGESWYRAAGREESESSRLSREVERLRGAALGVVRAYGVFVLPGDPMRKNEHAALMELRAVLAPPSSAPRDPHVCSEECPGEPHDAIGAGEP